MSQVGSDSSGDFGPKLPASVRRTRILESAKRDGYVAVAKIAARLGVSEMTVRRDLAELETKGLLDRTRGGAMHREVFDAVEPGFDRRRSDNDALKRGIAVAAAALIKPNETIGLDVGSTTLALAEEILGRSDLRIFTNNIRAAVLLSGGRSPVYLPGGQVRGSELSVVGPPAVAQLKSYFLDRVFIGASGLMANGFYDYSLEDTEIKRVFIAGSAQVVMLCDSSKFEHRALAQVCLLSEVNILVTDAPPPAHLAAALAAAGTRVVIAQPVASPVAGMSGPKEF